MTGSRKNSKKKRKPKARLPLPKKPGRPIGAPRGKKGYDRRNEKQEIEKQEEES